MSDFEAVVEDVVVSQRGPLGPPSGSLCIGCTLNSLIGDLVILELPRSSKIQITKKLQCVYFRLFHDQVW